MVLYDIACGLLSKSVSMGATYTLPMLCSLHLASFAFCLKILLLHSFYFIFPLGSDINCEPWAATTLPFLLQARGVPARYKRWTRARAWTWGVVEKLVSWIGSSRFFGPVVNWEYCPPYVFMYPWQVLTIGNAYKYMYQVNTEKYQRIKGGP